MTLQWVEGFEDTNRAGMFERYSTVVLPAAYTPAAGRHFGHAAKGDPTGVSFVTPPLEAHTTWIVGFALRGREPQELSELCSILSGSDTADQISLKLHKVGQNNYQIRVYRGATLLTNTGTIIGSSSAFNYIEWKVTIHGSTGSTEIKVNEVSATAGLVTGLNTANQGGTTGDRVRFSLLPDSGFTVDIDDVYIANGDTTGGGLSDYAGDNVVETLKPTAEGNASGWTPSSGTDNAALIDDSDESDEDATYVEAPFDNLTDLNVCADTAVINSTVCGVMVLTHARMTSAGTRNLRAKTRISSTNYSGTTIAVSNTTYEHKKQIWEKSPATASAWGIAEINGAEFGFESVP
jgi:hypothetical protein